MRILREDIAGSWNGKMQKLRDGEVFKSAEITVQKAERHNKA